MECRGSIVKFDKIKQRFMMWSSCQAPHSHRSVLVYLLGLDESQVRVIVPSIGGGFGPKLLFYPEDATAIHAAGAAIRFSLPVPSKLETLARYGWNVRQEVGDMLSAGCIDTLSGNDVTYLRALVDDFPLTSAA